MNRTKKFVSLLIVLTMLMSVMSIGAFAAGENAPASLLPLEEKRVSLDLTGYLPVELQSIPVRTILSNLIDDRTDEPIVVEDGVTTVWSQFKTKDDDYSASDDVWKKVGIDESIDMSRAWWYDLEIIVGSGLQLDSGNIRYDVDVEVDEDYCPFTFTLYTQDENGVRTEVPINQEGYELPDSEGIYYDVDYSRYITVLGADNKYTDAPGYEISIPSTYERRQEYYLSMTLKPEHSDISLAVYDGIFDTVEAAEAAAAANPAINISSQICAADMSLIDAGWKNVYAQRTDADGTRHGCPCITVAYKKNGTELLGLEKVAIEVYPRNDYINVDDAYVILDGQAERVPWEGRYSDETVKDGIEILTETIELPVGYSAYAEYIVPFYFRDGTKRTYNKSRVVKAVLGDFNSIEAATNEPDIKDKLFLSDDIFYEDENGIIFENGYRASFAGEGQVFTVFSDTKTYKIIIKMEESTSSAEDEEESTPDFSSSERDLRLSDAKVNNEELYGYVLPFEHDSYGVNGFQTLFVDDEDVDLTSVSPVVDLDEKVHVYTNGNLEETGDETYNVTLSPQNFTGAATADTPANTVKYTVSAENRSDQKNYWLNIVKKVQGAKLYVNGPDTREVFLDDAYGNKHDIFIANIGDQPLTGINVSLNATNVVLDDYWTVGGDGNNTLAPMDFSEERSYNNEHQNIAKIRIIPTGEGKIDGTLTVAADGQEPRVITLKGQAGNPRIDTETIPAGVKFVPYSSIITTTNIHDWNKVTFSLYSGKLPAGVELLPSGEIYGVPTETGDFSFRVMADYSYRSFSNSYADFTLHIDENTDENVAAQTDEGYGIMHRIEDMTNYTDQVFEIEGALVEFMDFWLDGQKLVRGVDYGAEEGSTKITINAQTFSKAGTGTHTIAGEFRKNGDRNNTMAKAAQNYTSGKRTVNKGNTNTGNTTNNSKGKGNSGSTGTNYKVVPINSAYTVGTQVVFNGGQVFVSSVARRAAARRGTSTCIITYLAPGTSHPYHLVSVDDGRVYGWVNAEDVEGGVGTETSN